MTEEEDTLTDGEKGGNKRRRKEGKKDVFLLNPPHLKFHILSFSS